MRLAAFIWRWVGLRWRGYALPGGIVVCLAVAPARAEFRGPLEVSVRGWDMDAGLPPGELNAVVRTPDGYLWLGMSSGLARFDGARFVRFTKAQIPGMDTGNVAALARSPSGELWLVETNGGLIRRRGGEFAALNAELPRTAGPATALVVGAGDVAWMGTAAGGLYRWEKGHVAALTVADGLPGNDVGALMLDRAGKLWALVHQRLGWIEGGRWHGAPGDQDPTMPFYALAAAGDGSLWVGMASENPLRNRGGRVFRFADGQPVEELGPYPWPDDSLRSRIVSVLEDARGRVWVGNRGAGTFVWTRGVGWRRVGAEGPLAQPELTAMNEDSEGLLWLVSRRTELFRVAEQFVSNLRLPSEAEECIVNSATATRDGSVWVGTDGAGVFRYHDGGFEQLTNGLASLHVNALLEDSQSNLWVGSLHGLQRWQRGDVWGSSEDLADREFVLSLFEDSQKGLWLSTPTALLRRAADGRVRRYGPESGLDHFYIRGLAEDTAGRICVAVMDRGLYRLKGDHFEFFGRDRWKGAELIRALQADRDGVLWIATLGRGLYRFQQERFRHWSTTEGLPDDALQTVIEDGQGGLWFSSERGIFGCSRAALMAASPLGDQPLSVRRLATAEGLESKSGSGVGQPVAARTADGRLWFPNRRSLAVFDPAQLPPAPRVWPVLVEEVLLEGETIAAAEREHWRFPAGFRRLEFRFTSPSLTTPERVRFRHRLEGWDEDWVEDGDRRAAQYTRLPPGHYQFRVMAGGVGGAWQEATRAIAVQIVPRFQERWEVRVLAGLGGLAVAAGVAGLVVRLRLRRRLRQSEARQAMEAERQRIARDLHDDLGAGLAEVVWLGEMTRRDSLPVEEVREHVADMTQKTRQLVAAMDEIVWTVNPRNDSLPNLASYVAEYARKFFLPTGIRCRLEIPPDLPDRPLAAAVRHHLFLAVKEALHNVAKHSGAEEVWLRLAWAGEIFTLAVEDNGRGFEPESPVGGGDGLGNLRQRLAAVGGRTTISSRPGKGTRVSFNLPLPAEERLE